MWTSKFGDVVSRDATSIASSTCVISEIITSSLFFMEFFVPIRKFGIYDSHVRNFFDELGIIFKKNASRIFFIFKIFS